MPRRLELAVAVVAVGALLFFGAGPGARLLPLNYGNQGADVSGLYGGVRLLVTGHGPDPFHASPPLYYPPQYLFLLFPLGWLNLGSAVLAAKLACVAALVGLVAGWRSAVARSWVAWAALLSLPTVILVYLAQLAVALGLLGLGLSLLALGRNRPAWAGVLFGLGLIRVNNALAVLVLVLLALWGRPRELARFGLGVAALMAPLTIAAFVWRPDWPAAYLGAVSRYQQLGPVLGLAALPGRALGVTLVLLLVVAGVAALGWRHRGTTPGAPTMAAGLGISVLGATFPAAYSAAFAQPALVLAPQRRGGRLVAAAAFGLPWLAAFWPYPVPVPAFILTPLVQLVVVVGLVAWMLRARRDLETPSN